MADSQGRSEPDSRTEEFIALLTRDERRINACILALVPNWAEAEEIAQEVKLRLWRQFGEYDPGSDFGAWARTIARNLFRTQARTQAARPHHFGQAFLDSVADEVAMRQATADRRQALLAACLQELGEQARDFLHHCYGSAEAIKTIAQQLGRTSTSVYKELERSRRTLQRCIERKLEQEEGS